MNLRLLCAMLLVCALGCDHPVPYGIAAIADNPPRTGDPLRLTFNPEGDHWPAFLPDGSALGYSYEPGGRRDRDRCLALIPPDGGRIVRQLCMRAGAERDSTNDVSTFGVSPGGRLALVAESGIPRVIFPDNRGLYVGSLNGPMTLVRPFPYTAPSGLFHLSAADMVWSSETSLVYLAMYWSYRPAIVDIPPDTEYTGIELVQLDLKGDSAAALRVVPNTAGATSLARGQADTVYFTMGGDSRVFSLATSTGQVATLFDFGALGIARDAQVANNTLVAVVGGRVDYYFRPSWAINAQADSGGPIYAVHLPGGTPVLIASISAETNIGSPTYRHLALDPGGRHVVAEVSHMVERKLREFTDTVVAKESDLWLFQVP